jgi:hypothetical protein
MNELKLEVNDLPAFEAKLRELGGQMTEPCWTGNWYLETMADRVLKIVQAHDKYRLQELQKLDTGFAYVGEKPVDDIAPYQLEKIPEHNVLHKTVRPWRIGGQSVDALVFEDIGSYVCVNYEDGERGKALDFIYQDLRLANPAFIEVPFNVLKRRKLGLTDFD